MAAIVAAVVTVIAFLQSCPSPPEPPCFVPLLILDAAALPRRVEVIGPDRRHFTADNGGLVDVPCAWQGHTVLLRDVETSQVIKKELLPSKIEEPHLIETE